MGANLWLQILTMMIFGWVALTLYIIWYETGAFFPALGHAYFWRWVIGGIITRAPLLKLLASRLNMPIAGRWYPLIPFTDWLNGPQLYHLPFTVWFAHYALRTALIPLALAIGAVTWRSRHAVDREHIRGLRLLTPRQHNRQLNRGWRTRQRQDREGIQLGTSVITANKECEHFLITGSPGGGKSTLIRHMLTQIEQRGQSAIVLDPTASFYKNFTMKGAGTWCLIHSIAAVRFGHRGWNSARTVSPWTAKPWLRRSSSDRLGRRPRNSSGNQAAR
jgi:hypothetical protein